MSIERDLQRGPDQPLGITELFGLTPWRKAASEARFAVVGDAESPRSRFGLSSLRQYRPRLSIGLYLGRDAQARRCLITNLFNYRQPDPTQGWSVRVTDVEDFRGRALTYDSHNGTDFAIPPGSRVVAPAPGRVVRVSSEFHRGGRKVLIDHGDGLITSCNHLARPLVKVGQRVRRGELIALSGYSGLDAVVAFPFSPPHVHFNTFLGGAYVDPFARAGEVSLWRDHNVPAPARGADLDDADIPPSDFDADVIEGLIATIGRAALRAELDAAGSLPERAVTLMVFMGIYPWLFRERPSIYRTRPTRRPRLDLPLTAAQYDGVVFADDL